MMEKRNKWLQSSMMELRILAECRILFSKVSETISRYRDPVNGYEIDIFFPNLKLGIELDSNRFHSNLEKETINIKKNVYFKNQRIIILRVREHQLNKLEEWDIIYHKKFTNNKKTHKEVMHLLLTVLLKIIKFNILIANDIRSYLNNKDWLDDVEYKNLISKNNIPDPSNSLATYSELCSEWDYEENGSLKPSDFYKRSSAIIGWKCEKGHRWKAQVSSRTAGHGCPYCKGRRATPENNLLIAFPEIAKEWNIHKNDGLLANEVLPTSHRKVWWQCDKEHCWESTVANRVSGNGCPYCKRTKASSEHNLEVKHPQIACEWHPNLNGTLTPQEVTPNSKRKSWWLCFKQHSYLATVNNRVANGSNCPFCAGQKATCDTNLATRYPNLITQWHPIKNESLTPYDVLPNSNKKVWWLCSEKHEWEAVVGNRTRHSSGCPFCSRLKKMKIKTAELPTINKTERKRISWRSFEHAKAYILKLKLQGTSSWRDYCKSNKKPSDIPSSPQIIYKHLGWKSWCDWLGTNKDSTQRKHFRSFKEAQSFVKMLSIKNVKSWRSHCKSANIPLDIPSNPSRTYKNHGWKSWGDWLGTKTIATKKREYRLFNQSRNFVHSLNLKNNRDWRKYCRSGTKPIDIPSNPEHIYRNHGWVSYGDWLGSGRLWSHQRKFLTFKEAKNYINSLNLKNQKKWREYCKSGKKPINIPSVPERVYKLDWISYGDWLGSGQYCKSKKGISNF